MYARLMGPVPARRRHPGGLRVRLAFASALLPHTDVRPGAVGSSRAGRSRDADSGGVRL